MKIEITADSVPVQKYFDNLANYHLPYARFQMVNALAFAVKEETTSVMKSVFDRPTKWTLESIFIRKARYLDWKDKKEVSAIVEVTDYKGQDKYIGHFFTGEDRAFKRFEARLKYANILPPGMWAVPGKAMPLDQYGNANRAILTQILRYLQSFTFVGDTQNMKEKAKERFRNKQSKASMGAGFEMVVSKGKGTRGPRGKIQNLAPGIYFRYQFASGSSLKPMIMFVRKKRGYQRKIFLDQIGDQVIKEKGNALLGQELAKAIANDKPTLRMLRS